MRKNKCLVFLSDLEVNNYFCRIHCDPESLPVGIKMGVHPIDADKVMYDYCSALEKGWRWLFYYWEMYQPRSFSVLESMAPELLVGEYWSKDPIDENRIDYRVSGLVKLGNQYLVFTPWAKDWSLDELGADHAFYGRSSSLPEGVRAAYYYRFLELRAATSLPGSPLNSRILPIDLGFWRPANEYCIPGKRAKDAMLAAIDRVVDKSCLGDRSAEDDFYVFLDARPLEGDHRQGDFLLVQESSSSGRVFHMRNCDWNTLSEVEDPARLMDGYVSRLLSSGGKVLDFQGAYKS